MGFWQFSELALRTTCRHLLPPEICKSTLVPAFSIFQEHLSEPARSGSVLAAGPISHLLHKNTPVQAHSHKDLETWKVSSVLDRG